MSRAWIVIAGLVGIIAAQASAAEEGCVGERCCEEVIEQSIGSRTAAAGVMTNLLGRSSSLKRAALEMLDEAVGKAASADSNSDSSSTSAGAEGGDFSCPKDCKPAGAPTVIFTSAPTKLLEQYPNHALCEKKRRQTAGTPFVAGPITFTSVEALSDWLMEFTRGRGDEGEKLYALCDGGCSPRYRFEIDQEHEQLSLLAHAVCGHKRDRSENTYQLETKIRQECRAE